MGNIRRNNHCKDGIIANRDDPYEFPDRKRYRVIQRRTHDHLVEQKDEWKKQRIIKTSGKNVTKLAEEYIVNFDRNKMNHGQENNTRCLKEMRTL